jgi:hypothetical protein
MSDAALNNTHLTREDIYHAALEVCLKTSADYLDVDATPAREELSREIHDRVIRHELLR